MTIFIVSIAKIVLLRPTNTPILPIKHKLIMASHSMKSPFGNLDKQLLEAKITLSDSEAKF